MFYISICISERANLTQIFVEELNEVGANVVAVACDSPNVQLSMMRLLGAVMDPENPDPRILREKGNIYHIQDICHALKLVRNAWHDLKRIKNSRNEVIAYSVILLQSPACLLS